MKIKIPVFLISITIGALASSASWAKCSPVVTNVGQSCSDAGGKICKDGGCYICCDDSDNGATNNCTGSYTTINTSFSTSVGSGYYVSHGYTSICKCVEK